MRGLLCGLPTAGGRPVASGRARGHYLAVPYTQIYRRTTATHEGPMDSLFDRLFRDFDAGRLSRRELLRMLGVAAIAVPAASFAQQTGRDSTGRGGRGRGNRAPADTTHAPAPFEPTGWKTVWLDHITYQCTDYPKAVAFYSALMGWKVRSDDGKQALLDIGDDVGGVIMTNGYVPPPPPPPRPVAPNDSAAGGRGGGRG